MFLVLQMDQGNLIVMFTNVISLTRKSMWWRTLMLFLQMFNPQIMKLYCMCLKTMKLLSRWLLKAEVLQWDTSPEPTELLLIGCLIELIWTPKSKSNTSTPKTNSLTFNEGNFTRHEWNLLLCLFQISNFSSKFTLTQWRNDRNKIQEQKNRDLWWSLLPGRGSCPVKKHYGSQDPWTSVAGEDRPGQPGKETELFEIFSSTDYSELDYDRVWSSLKWKTETTTYDRSGWPDKTSWRMVRKVRPDHEEILLDETAQSVRNGETLRDRSVRPDNIISQEVARLSKYRDRKRWTELEFVCRSKIITESGVWSSAKKTEKKFQRCRSRKRTIFYWVKWLWL